MKRLFCSSAAVSLLTACAGITLGPAAPNALTYYDPQAVPLHFNDEGLRVVCHRHFRARRQERSHVEFRVRFGGPHRELSGGMIASDKRRIRKSPKR